MKRKRRILIVDDHPLFREGLKSIIARSGALNVVGEAGESREGLAMALKLKPDIVLIDISLPDGDGTDLVREICTVLPRVICLVVTFHKEARYVAASFQAGAAGYFVKGSLPETFLEALEVVSQGGYFYDGPIAPETVERLKKLAPERTEDERSRYASLTNRQQEILKLIVQGLPYKTIGDRLGISQITVSHHRAQIMHKLGVKNRAELIQFAGKQGLVETGL